MPRRLPGAARDVRHPHDHANPGALRPGDPDAGRGVRRRRRRDVRRHHAAADRHGCPLLDRPGRRADDPRAGAQRRRRRAAPDRRSPRGHSRPLRSHQAGARRTRWHDGGGRFRRRAVHRRLVHDRGQADQGVRAHQGDAPRRTGALAPLDGDPDRGDDRLSPRSGRGRGADDPALRFVGRCVVGRPPTRRWCSPTAGASSRRSPRPASRRSTSGPPPRTSSSRWRAAARTSSASTGACRSTRRGAGSATAASRATSTPG